ncbi:6300_t:CDS:1 [Cetraspora pellucida]|uniref:6300_t:CDS:1 n=1 Tax=Cetraspora pellucida TaxID=1433469 RepID=A0A9N9EAH1_9GLOM|nr:6300_t:CDS:1 [Cetraspora pellucida]
MTIGLRTMCRPNELYKLKLKDIKFGRKLCWIRIGHSKTDQFTNRKFISIEYSNSPYCPIKLLKKYLTNRPKSSSDKPLFLSKQGKQLSVRAIGAIVKRIANNASIQDRFTAHSIRISGITTAMEAGLSLTQIRAIGAGTVKQLCYT